MMTNPPGTNEEMNNHNNHNTYSCNLTTLSKSSSMRLRHNTGVSVSWTSDEDRILVESLASFTTESSVTHYMKLVSRLQHKTIRDVAIRRRWLLNNGYAKRSKEDHNGLGRGRVDNNKEIVNKVVASQQFEPSQHGITNELLKQNVQWFSEINANLTSPSSISLMENSDLFLKILMNINTLVNNLNENASSETMKRMSPLPMLNDELLCAIFPSLNPQ